MLLDGQATPAINVCNFTLSLYLVLSLAEFKNSLTLNTCSVSSSLRATDNGVLPTLRETVDGLRVKINEGLWGWIPTEKLRAPHGKRWTKKWGRLSTPLRRLSEKPLMDCNTGNKLKYTLFNINHIVKHFDIHSFAVNRTVTMSRRIVNQ